jgi:hypothetical protein
VIPALRALLAVAIALMLTGSSAEAALDLFAQHEVTVQFATQDGKPLANTPVQVFAPGGAPRPDLAGHTDRTGKFEFPADVDGFWTAQAQSGKEVVRVMVRVGGPGQEHRQEPLSPYWAIGGLILLLVLAFTVRIMRARLRRRPRK